MTTKPRVCRQDVIDALKENDPLTTPALAEKLGVFPWDTATACGQLRKQGKIEVSHSEYVVHGARPYKINVWKLRTE